MTTRENGKNSQIFKYEKMQKRLLWLKTYNTRDKNRWIFLSVEIYIFILWEKMHTKFLISAKEF